MRIGLRIFWVAMVMGGCGASVAWGAPDDPVVEREVGPGDQQRNVFWGNQIDFDQYVFSSLGTADARRDWRGYAWSWLEVELEALKRDCELSAEQSEQIKLAFEGELARFDVRYRDTKAKWDELKKKDVQEFNQQIWQIISPLQMTVQSHWMGDASLTQRMMRGILNKEQLAKYDDEQKARQAFANETALALGVATLDDLLPMQVEQRAEVTKLLAGKMKVELANHGYIWVGGMMQYLAQIPSKKLEPIFTADQWKRLDAQLKQHRPQVRIQGGFKLFGR